MSYFRFQDIFINNQGTAMAGTLVYVCSQPVTTSLLNPIAVPPLPLAAIYGNSTGTVIPNPTVVDGNGDYFFYAAQGSYTLVFHDPYGRIPDQYFPDIQVVSPGGGTVTSVAETVPDGFQVAGSPISSTGTLAVTYTNDWQPNTFIAGPVTGSPTTPTRRALQPNDIAGFVGSGTVTSVGQTVPDGFQVSSPPILTSGTLAIAYTSDWTAHEVIIGPVSGSPGAPTRRVLVSADLPSLALKVNGTANASQAILNLQSGSNITVTDLGSGNVSIAGSSGGVAAPTIVSKTANYTAVQNQIVLVDTTSGVVTITLPAAASTTLPIWVKKTNSGTNNVVILPPSGTLDGTANLTFNTLNAAYEVVSDLTNFWVI
jgi:hypothetical protein